MMKDKPWENSSSVSVLVLEREETWNITAQNNREAWIKHSRCSSKTKVGLCSVRMTEGVFTYIRKSFWVCTNYDETYKVNYNPPKCSQVKKWMGQQCKRLVVRIFYFHLNDWYGIFVAFHITMNDKICLRWKNLNYWYKIGTMHIIEHRRYF